MSDRIILTGIRFYGYHGVHAEERRLGQHFLADVTLRLDLRPAEAWEETEPAVDYGRVHALVVEIGTGPPVRLLETLASRMAAALLDRFPVPQVTVRVTKLSPPLAGLTGGAAVEVTRP